MKIEVEITDEAIREFFGDSEKYEEQYGDNPCAVVGEVVTDMVLGNPSARQYRKALSFATNENLDAMEQEIMSEQARKKGDFLSEHMNIIVTDPDLRDEGKSVEESVT